MERYYDGGVNPDYKKNALNYSVIYRFASDEPINKVTFQLDSRANPSYYVPYTGIYVACNAKYVDGTSETFSKLILSEPTRISVESLTPFKKAMSGVDIIVSGMSSMPLTAVFE